MAITCDSERIPCGAAGNGRIPSDGTVTECERLIAEGRFSADFFKEEVRCGFRVSGERKKLWAIELDLYREFQRVCADEGLRYFAIFGTLLGAVRHGGFIPWDDDMDVAMPRADYERLCQMAGRFTSPYFLQRPGMDGPCCYSFAKLRNGRTTFMPKAFAHRRFNQGVFLDIFPMDRWVVNKGEAAYRKIDELNRDNSNFMRQGCPNPSPAMLERIRSWSGRDYHDTLKEIDALARQYENDETADGFVSPVITVYPYRKITFPREWFADDRTVTFEGEYSIPIPCAAEEILTMQFGDWRRFPPVEERGLWHAGLIVDADRPYTDYVT